MTERAISYLLLLAATVAVLLVIIIQPRNTAIQKQRMFEAMNHNLAQTCAAGDTACEASPLAFACADQGGSWGEGGCTYPSVNQAACGAAGYVWDEKIQSCLISGESQFVSASSLNEAEEFECFTALNEARVQVRDEYGGLSMDSINLVKTICSAAHAMGGVFGNSEVAYEAPKKIAEEALTALQNTQTPVIPYLTKVSLIFNRLVNAKSSPEYQSNALIYVKKYVTDPLAALLIPPPETKTEEVTQQKPIDPPPAIKTPHEEPVVKNNPIQAPAIQLLKKIKALFIRETGIVRTAAPVRIDSLKSAFLITQLLKAFTDCLNDAAYCRIP